MKSPPKPPVNYVDRDSIIAANISEELSSLDLSLDKKGETSVEVVVSTGSIKSSFTILKIARKRRLESAKAPLYNLN